MPISRMAPWLYELTLKNKITTCLCLGWQKKCALAYCKTAKAKNNLSRVKMEGLGQVCTLQPPCERTNPSLLETVT